MAAPRIDRTERLLNLVFALMASGQPVSRAAISASIPGYDPSAGQAAFERMFERDKDELRGLGVPIRTVLDVNGDVAGYTIDRDDYSLPEIKVSAAERSALALAASAWQNALVRSSASAGLRKLESESGAGRRGGGYRQGAEPHEDVSAGFVARINGAETKLLSLMALLRERKSVIFDYQSPQAVDPGERWVDPWGLVAHEGGWYLVGHDRTRDAPRAFRLSRMKSEPRESGEIAFPAPAGIDLRAAIDPASRSEVNLEVTVRVAASAGAALRRMSTSDVPFDREGDLMIRASDRSSVLSSVLFAGDGVIGVEPEDLRDEVVAALTAIHDAHAKERR